MVDWRWGQSVSQSVTAEGSRSGRLQAAYRCPSSLHSTLLRTTYPARSAPAASRGEGTGGVLCPPTPRFPTLAGRARPVRTLPSWPARFPRAVATIAAAAAAADAGAAAAAGGGGRLMHAHLRRRRGTITWCRRKARPHHLVVFNGGCLGLLTRHVAGCR